MSTQLFEIEEKKPEAFCRTCVHRQRWQCGGSVIQYCGQRTSNRTSNGLLKIKVTLPACGLYEPEKKCPGTLIFQQEIHNGNDAYKCDKCGRIHVCKLLPVDKCAEVK